MKPMIFSAAALAALAMTAPATAQSGNSGDHMMAADHMKMSSADMHKMQACQKMSHDAMMKDAGCAALAKAHPDMMKGGAMADHDAMMKKGH